MGKGGMGVVGIIHRNRRRWDKASVAFAAVMDRAATGPQRIPAVANSAECARATDRADDARRLWLQVQNMPSHRVALFRLRGLNP